MPSSKRIAPADRLAIMDMLASLARCLDSGDLEGYVNSFTADAVLFDKYAGHSAIRTYVDGIMQRRSAEGARSLHFVGYPTIEGQNGRARAYSYLLRGQIGAAPPIEVAAEYADDCVRVRGEWRIQRRSYSIPWRTKTEAPAAPRPSSLTADDRLALYEMAARYARAQDLLDVQAYLSNLTLDARVTDTHGQQFVGHDELRARFERRSELYPEPRQHFISQPWIEGSGQRCVMRMYWIVIYRRADDVRVLKQFGEYVDTCVKVDGRWLVQDRRIEEWPT